MRLYDPEILCMLYFMFLGFGVAILVGVNICAILCLWILGMF